MQPTQRKHVIPLAAILLALLATMMLLWIGDDRISRLLVNTAWLALGCCAVALPLGTVLALLLYRTDLPGRRILSLVFLVVLFMPLYLQAAGWDAGFGNLGWFSFSRDGLSEPLLSGWRAAVWIHGLAAIPWVVLIVAASLHFVEGEFEELALLEAPSISVMWHVTLRRSLPGIGVAALWIAIATAGEMTVTDLYQVRTYTEEIYVAIPLEEFRELGIQWRALVLVVAALTLVAVATTHGLAPTATAAPLRRPLEFGLGRYRLLAFGYVIGLALLIVCVPVLNLCVNAGVVVRRIDDEVVRSWEWGKLASMIFESPGRYSAEFGWSLLIGFLAAGASVAIAVPIAWNATRRAWGAIAALGIVAAGMAIPGPVIGLGVIWLLNWDSVLSNWLYDRTLLAPCLAMVIRCLPLTILVSWHALRSVSADVLEAAATEGVGASGRLLRIAAPQRVPAFAAAWLAAFAVSLGDLAATILVTPPGVSTIAIRVFGLLHAGVDDQVAGLCLSSVGMFTLIGCIAIGVWGRILRAEE